MLLRITKMGEKVLHSPAEPVTRFDAALRKLVDDMFETMYAVHGVGLAAPQVAMAKRLFVMDCSTEEDRHERVVMANPEILEADGTQQGTEGCLSVPGIFMPLSRPDRVRARGQNVEGEWFEIEVTGLEARCVLHECDHLDGKLYVDRLSSLKRDIVRRKVRKLKLTGEWED
jgi:peptide deformylase